MTPIKTKVCVQCGKTKLLVDFHRLRKGSEKRQPRCKRCDAERAAARQRTRSGQYGGRSWKYCKLCCGLPWRVVGARCRACGLEYTEEVVR